MRFDSGMFLRGYNPTPIEPESNALLRGLQMQGARQGNALNALKLQSAQQQMAEQQAAVQRQQAIEQAYRNALETPLQQAGAAGMTRPTPANAAAIGQMQPRFNPQRLAQELMPIAPMEAAKLLTPAAPDYKVVGDALLQIGPGGVKEAYKGTKAPSLPPGMQMGASGPEWIPGYLEGKAQVARAGAASTNLNYSTPVEALDAQGNRVFIRTTKNGLEPAVIPGVRPPMSAAEEKSAGEKRDRERQARQMVSVMDDARSILQAGRATESGVGNVVDAAARMVGKTTTGAQDAARLEAMSGWLVANVPRMEGPQSNIDVQNYTTMAGKVGDRTIPIAERLAALEEIGNLQRKYAAINGTPMPAAAKPATRGPAVGAVEGGYRFKGGDPSKASSWERVQ